MCVSLFLFVPVFLPAAVIPFEQKERGEADDYPGGQEEGVHISYALPAGG